MAKIGARIQETRLRRGLTLDRIADDTNIGVRFLAKIENDDFTGFPGEPYIVGFIRNYSEYLGLNAEEMVSLYRKSEAVEQEESQPQAEEQEKATAREPEAGTQAEPAQSEPMEPLEAPATPPKADKKDPGVLKVGRRGIPVPALRAGFFSALAILIVGAALLWIIIGGKVPSDSTSQKRAEPAEYRVEGGSFEQRLYVGDSILLSMGDDVYKLKVSSIDDTVEVETPFGPMNLTLGQKGSLDPDNNGQIEATLSLSDFEKGQNSSGALIRIEFLPVEPAQANGSEVTIPGGAPVQTVALPTPRETIAFKSSRGPYPIVIQVSFRGNCLFRYEADRKEWVEKYYSKGESITITMNSSMTLWASNAQAAKLTFQLGGGKTSDLEIGGPGEIAVKKLSWARAEGSWALISSELD